MKLLKPVSFLALLAAAIWLSYLAASKPFFSWDTTWASRLQGLAFPGVQGFMEGISILASPGATAASILILTAVLLYRRRFRDGFIALAVGIGDLLQEAINLLIGRPRPQGFSEPGDASFPSSHVFHTVLLLGVLLAVLLPVLHRGWQRWTLVGLAFSLALLMGFSRIYLGAHWPSDVLGAYVLGGLALWGVLSLRGLLRAVRRGQRPRPPERS